MINHVVLLNWITGVDEKKIEEITIGFSELSKNITEIADYSYGPNMGLSGSNFQYALVAKFRSLEDYQVYTTHKLHLSFMARLTNPIVSSYGAVQYES